MAHQVLSDQDIQAIHDASMNLLANPGVQFPYEPALEAFRSHGVHTSGERVLLTEDMVMKALASVPAEFTIHARNADRSVTVGDGNPVLAPGYGAPFLVDGSPSGDSLVGKREPTMDDYIKLVKLAHALPNQDLSGYLLVEPSGVNPDTVHLRMLQAHMTHSDKAFIGSTAGLRGPRHTMDMARILFGGDLSDRPVCVNLINSLTPLGYSQEMLEALVEFAAFGQPLVIAALAMAGSTAPITLAGTLAVQTAELLAGIVLTQLINPGTPVIFGSTSTNIDMKTGALAIGSPELSQMIVAHAQLARYYGLPSRSGGALTDASVPDAQAAFESMMSLHTTFASGIDFILHAGGILSSYLAFSFEKFVLDDEMCGIMRRFYEPLEVSPDTLALDIATRVGPGGNYLMEMHTVERCRSEFWSPAICDRSGLDPWMDAGMPTALERAHKRWQDLVERHEDPVLDGTVARQLKEYVDERLG